MLERREKKWLGRRNKKETIVETRQINTKRGVKDKVKKLIGKMQAI